MKQRQFTIHKHSTDVPVKNPFVHRLNLGTVDVIKVSFSFSQILYKKNKTKTTFLFLIIMKLIDPFFKKGNTKSRQSTWIYYIYTKTQHKTWGIY